MIDIPKCYERGCIHYLGIIQPDGTELSEIPNCAAYPEGIPDVISYGSNPHLTVRRDQDNDIVFEKDEQ